MSKEQSCYLNDLKSAAKNMIRFSGSTDFVDWVPRYFVDRIRARHISVALYDSAKKIFPIRASSGKGKIPPSLIAFDSSSPLVQWFADNPRQETISSAAPKNTARSEHLSQSQTQKAREQLRRYHVDICFKIGGRNAMTGYLLVGARADETSFDKADKAFLKTIADDITVEIEKEEFRHRSLFDPLTGLLNRGTFNLHLAKVTQHEKRTGLAMIDVDNFKKINDQHGHPAGDQVLKIVAQRIRSGLRKSDKVFRYGGEEIAVLIEENSRKPAQLSADLQHFKKKALKVMERVRKKIAGRPFVFDDKELFVSVSVGVSFCPENRRGEPEKLLKEADQALYASKHNGKNQVTVFCAKA